MIKLLLIKLRKLKAIVDNYEMHPFDERVDTFEIASSYKR